MAGESQQAPSTGPDPSVLTTENLIRATGAERDYVNAQLDVIRERLRGIDIATRLLNETVNRVPTDVQREVSHLRELAYERIDSATRAIESVASGIALQFTERDTRSEREARDNTKAVDAAFAAQKESAAQQNEANSKAIAKSETQTTEAIAKLAELFKSTTDSLADQIGDNKDAVAALALDLKQTRRGNEAGTEARASTVATLIAVAGLAVVFVGVLVAVVTFTLAH
jgi:hypothetical protein